MDTESSEWIFEFLLRQNLLEQSTFDELICTLPISTDNPRLNKSLILQKIEFDIQKRAISDDTIKYLELIGELDQREGSVVVSEAMKTAYCTVVMRCAAKSTEEGAGDTKDKYASAVSRIQSGRILGIEMSDVSENVLARFESLDVFDVLCEYVNEAKEKMGPSFLELACGTILSDKALSKSWV